MHSGRISSTDPVVRGRVEEGVEAGGELGQATHQVGEDEVEVIGHKQEIVEGDAALEGSQTGRKAVPEGLGHPFLRHEPEGAIDGADGNEQALARDDIARRGHAGGIGQPFPIVHDKRPSSGSSRQKTFGRELRIG